MQLKYKVAPIIFLGVLLILLGFYFSQSITISSSTTLTAGCQAKCSAFYIQINSDPSNGSVFVSLSQASSKCVSSSLVCDPVQVCVPPAGYCTMIDLQSGKAQVVIYGVSQGYYWLGFSVTYVNTGTSYIRLVYAASNVTYYVTANMRSWINSQIEISNSTQA